MISTIINYIKRKIFLYKIKTRPFSLPEGAIYVNYCGVLRRNQKYGITGGKVKLIHLDKIFPEQKEDFNILYLISSALPEYAPELVAQNKEYGAKFVLNQNGVGYPGWAGSNTERINKQLRILIHEADFVFYQSRFCKKSADTFLGEVSCPWDICYNCVDTEFFIPPPQAPSFETWKIISTGTHLMWPQRVVSALEAIAILKKRGYRVMYLLAGALKWDNSEEEVNDLIDSLDIRENVKIISEYKQEHANKLYQRAHVLLHPMYNDACPTVTIEAMASGVPIVGSNSGGTPELIGDDAGILIDGPQSYEKFYFPDPNQLAGAIVSIMENWNEFSWNACNRAKLLFDKKLWLEKHVEVFKKLLQL